MAAIVEKHDEQATRAELGATWQDAEGHCPNDLSLLSVIRHEAAAKAEALARAVGGLALQGQEVTTQAESETTLLEAIQDGNEALVKANVQTDIVERTFKAGHVTKIYQAVDDEQITQHGQTSEQVQFNTLKYANANPLLRKRTIAEVTNMYYIDSLRRAGLLEENYAVVVSLCPDADDETLRRAGFFPESKSLSLQATTEEQGAITTESAFVAGVAAIDAPRRDYEVAVQFAAHFGAEWSGLSDAEMIGHVLLIPKSAMPNGVVDLVKLWDDMAGGTFFGQLKPRQDYAAYLEVCRARERALEPTAERVVAELMSLSPVLKTPLEATNALSKIAEKHMLDRALVDHSIDARVFGTKAAMDLAEARFHYERGNMQQVQSAMNSARKNARSGSCASGASISNENSPYNDDGTLKTAEQIEREREEKDPSDDSDEYGPLTFYCTEGHKNTRRRGELLTACKHQPCKQGSVGCNGMELVQAASQENQKKPVSGSDLLIEALKKLVSKGTEAPQQAAQNPKKLRRSDLTLAA